MFQPITHSRSQVMYRLDVGSDHHLFNSEHPAMKQIAKQVSYIVGGCTLIDSKGYWADVERADRASYHDVAVGVENNVQLQVKAEVEKESKIESVIVQTFVKISEMYPELGINWVCGEKVMANGITISFNFSVLDNQ
jgi:hypothetical protein